MKLKDYQQIIRKIQQEKHQQSMQLTQKITEQELKIQQFEQNQLTNKDVLNNLRNISHYFQQATKRNQNYMHHLEILIKDKDQQLDKKLGYIESLQHERQTLQTNNEHLHLLVSKLQNDIFQMSKQIKSSTNLDYLDELQVECSNLKSQIQIRSSEISQYNSLKRKYEVQNRNLLVILKEKDKIIEHLIQFTNQKQYPICRQNNQSQHTTTMESKMTLSNRLYFNKEETEKNIAI